jgi:hypothetical protein
VEIFLKGVQFCDRKCYLEYYRAHPERWKRQRIYAGHVSIESFRNKRNFEYAGIKFSSESEKQTAIFLEKEFNIKLEERKNCHVKINNIEVDFLVDKVVIEYHQCYNNSQNLTLSKRIEIWRKKKYRYEYRTLQEYFKTRRDKIPIYFDLIVIQNVTKYSFKKLKEFIMLKQEIENIRRIMGTLPDQEPEKKTDFHIGVTGMKNAVKLIDWPHNPYKSMYVMATSCWGKKIDKWSATTPQGRFMVVLAVLKRQALPLAYEAPSFTFAVEKLPRWSFDQICRARQGIVFSSQGTRDNNHRDAGFFVHDEIAEDEELFEAFKSAALHCKDVYDLIINKGKGSWQSARSIFPISNTHAFSFAANFAALQNLLSRRMKFCEADATVAFAWLVQKELAKTFPLLADFCRPGCDFSGKCGYNSAYSMSNMFGCLFAPCGRNMGTYSEYAEFNKSCTDKNKLEEQLDIKIQEPNEWIDYTENDFYKLDQKDIDLFESN